MKAAKIVTAWLCRHSGKYKLHRICKALGIRPYDWQREFALGKAAQLRCPMGRQTGKTHAVMLRMLMENPADHGDMKRHLRHDPDFCDRDYHRRRWYHNEYRRLAWLCAEKGIPVVQLQKKRPDEIWRY